MMILLLLFISFFQATSYRSANGLHLRARWHLPSPPRPLQWKRASWRRKVSSRGC